MTFKTSFKFRLLRRLHRCVLCYWRKRHYVEELQTECPLCIYCCNDGMYA